MTSEPAAARLATVGLLGGMSWESTAVYYRLVNTGVRERAGGLHSAPLLLWSADFAEVERYQRAGDWTGAGVLLGDAARRLQDAGAAAVAIATNTMHLVAGAVRARLDVPLISLLDVVAAAATARGVRRLGLLGTGFTMTSDLYPAALAPHGVEVLTPPAAERDEVHRVIYSELCRGEVREASRQAYRRTIAGLAERGADAVALACTEIMLLIGPDDSPVPLLDTTTLHAEAITDFVVGAPIPTGAAP
jgi:aspartate racemase